jgi:hypothetical protein
MENKKLILEQKITKLAVEQLMEKYNAGQLDEAGFASAMGGLKNLAGKVANKFVDKAQQVKQGIADTGREIKGAVNYAGNEIKDAARGAVKSVSDTTQNIKQGATNAAGQIKTAYKQGALPVQRQETEKAFETFAKALNAYNQEARKYSAEPLSIQGMLNRYRRTYPNLFKEAEEPICDTKVIKESEDKDVKESKDEKWIQDTDMKKGKLKKRLGLADDEKLTIGRVNSELKKLKDKCKDGEKLSKEDSTFEKELNLAKTLLSSKK